MDPWTDSEMPSSPSRDGESQTALSAQVFQILLSLLDDDLHGYALIQDIRRRTDGEVVLTASTLYAAAKRLLGAGWIEEVEHETPPPGHDPRRRYYRITARGREAARAEALRLERLTAMARDKRLLGAFRSTPHPKGSR
jgi:DNA-binding PadR family transcriptional regulator